MRRILFVCTGNTCRSPMAEALLRRIAEQKGVAIDVRSAGVSTIDGLSVSPYALDALRSRAIEHSGSSKALTSEMVNWSDLILSMTSAHKRDLLQWFPEAVDKTYTLKEYTNQDENVLANILELEQLYTELQMRQTLGQQLTGEERQRLLELERRIPSFDIADPFGGSLSVYENSLNEIEEAVYKLVDKLYPHE